VNPEVRRRAGEAWAFRSRVEQDAARRFQRLSGVISGFDAGSPVPELLQRAAEDEVRHASLCKALAESYGHAAFDTTREHPIAPSSLDARGAALYEMVAACCITETESMATLATLLAEDAEAPVASVLREIARDEVAHGQMGWAHLAREAERTGVAFLSRFIPSMLAGAAAEGLFSAADAEAESPDLLRHGVLPHSTKKRIFVGTLEGVILPGLDRFGIDTRPARAWLQERR
jgi:Rubrerythrin